MRKISVYSFTRARTANLSLIMLVYINGFPDGLISCVYPLPIQDRPKLFYPLFLSPNTVPGTHPSVLIHRDTEQRVQDLASCE